MHTHKLTLKTCYYRIFYETRERLEVEYSWYKRKIYAMLDEDVDEGMNEKLLKPRKHDRKQI